MRALTDRLRDDDGATLVLVALVLFSLLAVSALAVDTAALVQERRTLQNGADAAALAVAKDCSGSDCLDYRTNAGDYARSNADDGAVTVPDGSTGVCGTAPLPPCSDPPTLAAGARGYVRVTTRTRTADGSDEVPFTFARVMGFTGATVQASATVAWGPPKALDSELPLTISVCEWSEHTANGTVYAPPPPYPASQPYPPAPAVEQTIYFHTQVDKAPRCPQRRSGGDLPGGFGWLNVKESTACQTESAVDGWIPGDTGRPAPDTCDQDELSDLVGHVVHVPVYDSTDGTGGGGEYLIKGYAAFYLTGYSINGQDKHKSLVTGTFPCKGNDSCISGFFVSDSLAPSTGSIGDVPSMGTVVVQFVG